MNGSKSLLSLLMVACAVAGSAGIVAARHMNRGLETDVGLSLMSEIRYAEGNGDRADGVVLARFSPEGFRRLYDDHLYSNTDRLSEPPFVTGDAGADRRIVGIAEQRGYRLRSAARSMDLVEIDGRLLQVDAKGAWEELKREAFKNGIELGLISGYRSIDRQRTIFLGLLSQGAEETIGREYTNDEIASGAADALIDRILSESSVPGFSKHHTGYTIDITDVTSGLDFTEFSQTAGFHWLSEDNYLNAKRFGFVPSYPEGAGKQGPDPEAWEYVWVGATVLQTGDAKESRSDENHRS